MTGISQSSDIKKEEFAVIKFSARKSVQLYVGQVIDSF